MELLNPLQSLGFAGAGVLLGTAVQQQATKNAEEVASENLKAASQGKALASVVKVKASAHDAPKAIKDLAPLAERIEGQDPK